MAELAIVENVQRKDLNAIEKAVSFQRYIEEYQCTQEDLASRVHIDRSTVANLIRLLELPEEIKQLVMSGEISQGHARALLPLGDEESQVEFARRIVREGMSVRATENSVSNQVNALDDDLLRLVDADGNRRKVSAPRNSTEHIASLEQQLKNALGASVEIRQGARGKGRITIHFHNGDEFERLMRALSWSSAASAAG
jgi:ParB family chromosome partitioning protein